MKRDDFADLVALAAVAEERSFTKAAHRLGMSQSALSQVVTRLEARLGLRLLARTTRSVAPTQAGEELVATLGPMLRDLDSRIATLSELRETPAGSFRITAVEHAARKVLIPKLARFLPGHPDITVEVVVDYGLTDIVASRFDAGIRLGEQIERDMIAVRISPPVAMAIVGSPAYLADRAPPLTPQDLARHHCLNLRMPSSGAFYEWRLAKRGKAVHARLDGQLVLNALEPILDAALAGLGLANVPLDQAAEHIAAGRLVRVLDDWIENLPPYYLYYPHRRHASAAFNLLVEGLREH